MAALEITTRIGCRVSCTYCPQDKILAEYSDVRGGGHMMTFETYARCLKRVPTDVTISFAGFTEPFLNPDCLRMILHARSHGHAVQVFTTLYGLPVDDVPALLASNLNLLVVHLPADDQSMRLQPDATYLDALTLVAASKTSVRLKFHGERLHPQVAAIVGRARRTPIHTRAGNVTNRPAPPRLFGEITCKREPVPPVLLPNGDVALCCMDWSLRHPLGNLLAQSYADIVAGPQAAEIRQGWKDESMDILCRTCDKHAAHVVPATGDLRRHGQSTML